MNHNAIAPTTDDVGIYLRAINQFPLLNADQEKDLGAAIEAGLYAGRLLDEGRTDADLKTIRDQGHTALETLVNSNLRLVIFVARRFAAHPANRPIAFLDLIQEGNLGLWRAAQKFDFTRDIKFSTYAVWWIRNALGTAVADQRRLVRLPLAQHAATVKIAGAMHTLATDSGRRPTLEEVSAETGFAVPRIRDLVRWDQQSVSLDETHEDSHGVYDSLWDPADPQPLDAAVAAESARLIRSALGTLPDREAAMVSLRFGLADGREHSFKEIGALYGVTSEVARRTVGRSLAAVKRSDVSGELLDCYEPSPSQQADRLSLAA